MIKTTSLGIKSSLALNGASAVLLRGSAFIVGLFLARALGPSVYSEFVFLRSLTLLFETAVGITLGVVFSRAYASLNVKNGTFVGYPTLNAHYFFGAVCSIIFLGLTFVLFFVFDFSFFVFFPFVLYSFGGMLFQFLLSFEKGIGEFKLTLEVSIIVILIILAFGLMPNQFYSISIAFCVLSVVYWAGFVYLYRKSPEATTFPIRRLTLYEADFSVVKSQIMPVSLSSLISPFGFWLISLYFIGYSENKDQLAFFNVSFLIYGLMGFPASVISDVFFSKFIQSGSREILSGLFLGCLISIVAVFPMSLFFLIYPEIIVFIYGSDYSGAIPSLKWLSLAALVSSTLPLLGKTLIFLRLNSFNLYTNAAWAISIFVFIIFFENFFTVYDSVSTSVSASLFFAYLVSFLLQWLVIYFRVIKSAL